MANKIRYRYQQIALGANADAGGRRRQCEIIFISLVQKLINVKHKQIADKPFSCCHYQCTGHLETFLRVRASNNKIIKLYLLSELNAQETTNNGENI